MSWERSSLSSGTGKPATTRVSKNGMENVLTAIAGTMLPMEVNDDSASRARRRLRRIKSVLFGLASRREAMSPGSLNDTILLSPLGRPAPGRAPPCDFFMSISIRSIIQVPQIVKHAEHQHEDTNYFDFRNTFFKKLRNFDTFYPNMHILWRQKN